MFDEGTTGMYYCWTFGVFGGSLCLFQNAIERAIHFQKHGHEFGAADEFVYEQIADNFSALDADTSERQRVVRPGQSSIGLL